MKLFTLPVFLLLILLSLQLTAQESMGFGSYEVNQDFPCLTDEKRMEIQAQIDENVARLQREGRLPQQWSEDIILFEWPVVGAPGQTDYDYYGISNFVDLDENFPNQLQDYNCGERTYDLTSGYNHRGIDMFTWPFAWYRMDHDEVIIVASAPGMIVLKSDGNNDRSCGFNSGNWNAVYVQHSDGSVTWYGHMKNGSTTSKQVGDSVAVGEYLGVVGSSGSSTGPHLHMETRDGQGNLIEPYSGSCNNLNSESWWNDQRPYYDSAINRLMTHSAPPTFPACPTQEIINEKNDFVAGEVVYFASYYRDQLENQQSNHRIYRPDNSVFRNWNSASSEPHYVASWWWWSWELPINAASGVWKYEIVYEGVTYSHEFNVGVTAIDEPTTLANQYELAQNYPNPFNPETTIEYHLAKSGNVSLKIYNSLGQQIRTLIEVQQTAGRHSVNWDGRDALGNAVPGGTYFYRISSGNFVQTRKMTILK